MAEYIDREALKQDIRIMPRTTHPELVLYSSVQKIISNCPTVDVVEVVRCKDCKYCEVFYPCKAIGEESIEGHCCRLHNAYRKPTDFCSYGIKRGEDND